jgi:hypothetical protein
MPQALLSRPVLHSQLQPNIELQTVGEQKPAPNKTVLAAFSVQNEWLLSAHSPPSFRSHGAAPIYDPGVQNKPATLPAWLPYRRNAAAICIAMAIVSLVLFYRWTGLATASNPAPAIHIQDTPTQAPAQMSSMLAHPVTLTPMVSFKDDSSISANPPAWQTFTVNRESNAHWRVGIDLLPGSVAINELNSPATTKAAAAPIARISLDRQTVTVSDRATFAVLLLNRSGSRRNPATVHWRTISGTAKPGVDYQDEPFGIARFADNQSTRALYVQVKQNDNSLGNRSFSVELSKPLGNAALGKISRTVITIQSSN